MISIFIFFPLFFVIFFFCLGLLELPFRIILGFIGLFVLKVFRHKKFCPYFYSFFVCPLFRWSAIATHLPKRTDNEIKNYWNTHLKKRLAKMGIDPVTHKPKNDALLSGDGETNKNAANLSHMAQWESARLEAEARLVRESKLRSHGSFQHHQLSGFAAASPSSTSAPAQLMNKAAWGIGVGGEHQLESPTSTLTFSENNNNNNTNVPPVMNNHAETGIGLNTSSSSTAMIEFVGTSSSDHHHDKGGNLKETGDQDDWKGLENSLSFTSSLLDMTISVEGANWNNQNDNDTTVEEGFTNLLLNDSIDQSLTSDSCKESDTSGSGAGGGGDSSSNYYQDNKNYWNSILNLVNSSPSNSPMF